MSDSEPPAAATAIFRFSSVTSVCLRMSPSPISLPSGPIEPLPARKIRLACRVTQEYGPIAAGNPDGLKHCLGIGLGLSREHRLHERQRLSQSSFQAR